MDKISFNTNYKERLERVLKLSKPKFKDQSHLINVAVEGYLALREEKLRSWGKLPPKNEDPLLRNGLEDEIQKDVPEKEVGQDVNTN